MKKIICMFLTLLLLVCIVGCSQAKDSDNHVVQDYSEEYEVSPYGSEEALDTLDDLKISMSTEKDLDLKHLSFLIENTSDKEYQYSPDYFEIEAEQSGTWYQLKQLDDPSKSNEKDCFIKPNERLTLEIDVKSFYGELPAGHYRLIKQFAFLAYILEHDINNLTEDHLREMLIFANAGAALVTTKKGAICSMPEIEEVEKLRKKYE